MRVDSTLCSLASLFPFREAGAEPAMAQLHGRLSQGPQNALSGWNWQPPETDSSRQRSAGKDSPTFQQLMLGAGPSLGYLSTLPLCLYIPKGGKEQRGPVTWMNHGPGVTGQDGSRREAINGQVPEWTGARSNHRAQRGTHLHCIWCNTNFLKIHVSFSEHGLRPSA